MRFKIDLCDSYRPFGLYVQRQKWWGAVYWDRVDVFGTRELAKAFHEKIKDLPEYL